MSPPGHKATLVGAPRDVGYWWASRHGEIGINAFSGRERISIT